MEIIDQPLLAQFLTFKGGTCAAIDTVHIPHMILAKLGNIG
jgi:hypothetical protein